MGRMVVVGGEVQSRGLFGGNRTAPEWIGLSVAIGTALLIVLAGGSQHRCPDPRRGAGSGRGDPDHAQQALRPPLPGCHFRGGSAQEGPRQEQVPGLRPGEGPPADTDDQGREKGQ